MRKIKAIIFDMDGVLIDAKEWHYEALNKALCLFGYEITRHEHLVSYDGLPTKEKLRMLSLERALPEKLHDFINEMKQRYTVEAIFNHCRPYFTHQYALAKLKQQKYKIAVCSNSIRDTVQLMMEKSDLLRYIDFFISNQDIKKAKPDPEMYLMAVKKLSVKPEECLVLEDNKNGIIAAETAGCNVYVVDSIEEVNFANINKKIKEIEAIK